MCKQEQKIWYTAMDDTTPYSGEVEIDTSKKSKKAYGIGHCWKCHNGNGIFWKKTWNGFSKFQFMVTYDYFRKHY